MNKIVNSIIVFFLMSAVIVAGPVNIQQRYLGQTKRNAIPEIPGKRGMALDFNKADKPAWLAKVLRPAKDGWSLGGGYFVTIEGGPTHNSKYKIGRQSKFSG